MCNGCRGKVEGALAAVAGGESASVVLESKTAAELVAAVEAAGKTATLMSSGAGVPSALSSEATTPATPAKQRPSALPPHIAALEGASRGGGLRPGNSPSGTASPMMVRLSE